MFFFSILRRQIQIGCFRLSGGWKLSDSFNNHTAQLKKDDAGKIQLFHDKYVSLKGKKLLQHVYRGYPYYAINSLVANEILTADEYAAVQKLKAPKKGKLFATIGYEGITVEEYLNRLIENDIRLLVDVRKNPLSRKYGFSKTKLSELLNNVGISYKHLPKLGIVSDKRKSLKTSQDYKNLFSNYEKTVIPEESAIRCVIAIKLQTPLQVLHIANSRLFTYKQTNHMEVDEKRTRAYYSQDIPHHI